VRLKLVGELDLATVPMLEEELKRLRAEKVKVRLDLSQIDFIDSTGIRLLFRAVKESRDGGMPVQVDPTLTTAVKRALSLVQLDEFLVDDGQRV
jgi:anti-anti-sigma factor